MLLNFPFIKVQEIQELLISPNIRLCFIKKAHQRTLIKRLTLIRRHCSWSIENRSIFFTTVEVVLILLLRICLVTIRRDTSVDQEDISIQSNNLVLVQPYRSWKTQIKGQLLISKGLFGMYVSSNLPQCPQFLNCLTNPIFCRK